jgi:hypothetical protein
LRPGLPQRGDQGPGGQVRRAQGLQAGLEAPEPGRSRRRGRRKAHAA